MKKILFVAIMAGAMFACNKQDEITGPEENTGENTVTLTVKQAAQTRAISDQKGSSEYAVIGSGKIYFIDASGNNIHQRELTATEIAALANTASTAGGNTVTVTGIPNTAITLYFVANLRTTAGTSYPAVMGTGRTEARFRIDQLQADAVHVPMAGRSTAFTAAAGAHQYTASVELTPLVARFELAQITCQNQDGAAAPAVNADITGYKLSGVFMNNIHPYVLLDGTPYLVGSSVDIRNQPGWATNWGPYFNSYNTDFPYYVGGNPAAPSDWVDNAMADYCTPTSAGLTFYPDPTNGATTTNPAVTPKKAWAYQVCPSLTFTTGTPADVPHLILKLTEVAYVNNDLGKPIQYVTVMKYKDSGGNPVNEFKPGNVYRIENLIFTHNEATAQPYEENITVTATVSVKPWTINIIKPGWE
ncbi:MULTISPECIES: hypothetical protein [Culturomica]|uniref:hypothetical protein n=1 Tax=Culturomica TaxID=1926651 RepID=UPI000E95ABFD|nr:MULTISPECIES: hypothetical protein [Culturomica]HBO26480.1 hypothetical protein [Culturomica sp.]